MNVFIIIITILLLLALIIYKSTIRLNVIELSVTNKKINKLKIEISILFLNKLKWLKIEINKEKIKKLKETKINNWFNKIIEKNKIQNFKKIRKIIMERKQKLYINIEEINTKLKISTTNVILTSMIFVVLNIIISIFLATNIRKYNKDKHKYEIIPNYQNNNFYELNLNCIISVKIAHIINMIKRKRSDKRNARTSNRIFNGNCYE